MAAYVALLRGINVGGNNLIRMADLKASFEGMGFDGVRTVIQSGNVVFRTADGDGGGTGDGTVAALTAKIERGLSRAFGYDARVAVRSHDELAAVVRKAPRGFGAGADHRWYVVFLLEPATPADVVAAAPPRAGVDRVTRGEGVVYFATLMSGRTRSSLNRVIGTPVYQSMTIRSWSTAVKLLELSGD
jgi:uncharacterized protein (DUF1697 family)